MSQENKLTPSERRGAQIAGGLAVAGILAMLLVTLHEVKSGAVTDERTIATPTKGDTPTFHVGQLVRLKTSGRLGLVWKMNCSKFDYLASMGEHASCWTYTVTFDMGGTVGLHNYDFYALALEPALDLRPEDKFESITGK